MISIRVYDPLDLRVVMAIHTTPKPELVPLSPPILKSKSKQPFSQVSLKSLPLGMKRLDLKPLNTMQSTALSVPGYVITGAHSHEIVIIRLTRTDPRPGASPLCVASWEYRFKGPQYSFVCAGDDGGVIKLYQNTRAWNDIARVPLLYPEEKPYTLVNEV